MDEIQNYVPDKIEFPALESKMIKLGDTLLNNSASDRDQARRIEALIQEEISEMKAEYERAVKKYEEKIADAETIDDETARKYALKEIWRPKRPDLTHLISEMNKALEVGITSSDNIVRLLDVLTKLKLNKKESSEFDEINMVKNRTEYLKKPS